MNLQQKQTTTQRNKHNIMLLIVTAIIFGVAFIGVLWVAQQTDLLNFETKRIGSNSSIVEDIHRYHLPCYPNISMSQRYNKSLLYPNNLNVIGNSSVLVVDDLHHLLLIFYRYSSISLSQRYKQSILYPENVIFRVTPLASKSYTINWKSFQVGSKMQSVTFPSVLTDLNKWAMDESDDNLWKKKTFIILYGDSNERIPLHQHLQSKCTLLHPEQYCCDIEQEKTINVTFCNIFTFSIDPNDKR